MKCCSAISTRRIYIWSSLAYVAVVAWLYLANEGQTCIAVCPSKLFYGLPCPGCGTTRATLQLLHGNLLAAVRLNPNCLLAAAFLLFYPLLLLLSLASLLGPYFPCPVSSARVVLVSAPLPSASWVLSWVITIAGRPKA